MPSKLSGVEMLPNIKSDSGPHARALIVDRDSMSSQLLADALVRGRKYDASAILSSDLSRTIDQGGIELVVIGADVKCNSGSGLDLAQLVGQTHPGTGIVILLNQPSRTSVITAFRSGARGVFSRQQTMTEFLECVDFVRRGYIWAGRAESSVLLAALRNIPGPTLFSDAGVQSLTVRELEVVQKAAQGKTNRVIALELGLSEHTVKNYLFRAFDKVGVSSRVELLFCLTVKGHTFSKSGGNGVENAGVRLGGREVQTLATPHLPLANGC
ncbi:two component transcriptional regulator, LuxR family [Acidisarcina polymorpha]|uniref:Two component transcriptional regulator, LuxR family n=1 Tax=Acidisarcina polymorpha TaxID=2211140 RepID=A0A2Z5G3K4_9BACT|nr:response regulator transcription factor [Acidisarcina polymorpha]AXC13688.1 two component transcriptional regulator, LuxR family [Acidisarcina polymorpha]